MTRVLIAASILAADFAALGQAVADAEAGGADLIHVDVMDGHFVPNLTVGPPVVRSLKKVATVPLDVHLMIEEPDRYAEEFVKAGAARLSVHVEVLPHLHRSIQYIRSLGARAGVAINPATPVCALEEIAGDVDHVLVMSVNPGFGGQTFIPRSESKIQAIRALLDAAGNPAPIEVDGGVDAVERRPPGRCRGDDSGGRDRHLREQGSGRRDPRPSGGGRCRRPVPPKPGAKPRATADPLTVPSSVTHLRVRYAETDKMGVVYYANYLVWFEVARTDLLRSLGWSYREMEGAGVILPVIEAHCEYQRPARYDDEIEVRTEGVMLSPVRMQFNYTVVRHADGVVAACGRTVHAAVDARRPAVPASGAHPAGVRVKALVTGAAGFIGSHLAEALLEKGWQVTGLDCFTDYYPRAIKEANLDPTARPARVPLHSGQRPARRPCRRCWTERRTCFISPRRRACGKAGDATSGRTPTTTSTPRSGCSRRASDARCSASCMHRAPRSTGTSHRCRCAKTPFRSRSRRTGSPSSRPSSSATCIASITRCPTAALRYFTVYGPRQRPDMAFHRFIRASLDGTPVTLYGDGQQTRDFTYVADAVAATIAAGERGVPGRAYNVGGGSRVSMNHVIEIIGRVAGKPLEVRHEPAQKGDMRDTYADTSLARADLGFAPSVTLEQGIEAEYRWLSSVPARA